MPAEDATLQEIEIVRRRVKRERMNNDLATVPQMFSLWQETTDLLFRTNLGDDSRVEELHHLGRINFALTAEAYRRNKPRGSLQKLQSVLRTLVPREWFQDRATHDSVAEAVHAANVEVQELYFSSMPPNREAPADAMQSLHTLAMNLLEESRAYLQFRLGYGHDWNELRRRIPTHLRAIQIEVVRAWDDFGKAQHELQQATEQDIWSNERGTRYAKARSDDPDNLDATRATLIAEIKQAVAVAEACFLRAKATVLAAEDERLEAERMLARQWREEHLPRLNGLIVDFRPEFERHRHKLGGFVDLSQHDLGELARGASSACQILLTFAERVASSRQQTFQRLEPDMLRVLVEREIGFLARSTSPESPTPPLLAVAAAQSKSPTQQPSVIPPPQPVMPVPAAHRPAAPEGISNLDILVLRALPKSTEPALRTQENIAARVDTRPRPSVSSMSRSIRRLRATTPPLADPASYRRTPEGDAAEP